MLKNMRDMGLAENKCPYCKREINSATATDDHIIPKNANGNGSNVWQNRIYACGTCNNLIKSGTVYRKKKLPAKTILDAKGKRYIPDKDMRRAYVAGIRSVILQEIRSGLPLK